MLKRKHPKNFQNHLTIHGVLLRGNALTALTVKVVLIWQWAIGMINIAQVVIGRLSRFMRHEVNSYGKKVHIARRN